MTHAAGWRVLCVVVSNGSRLVERKKSLEGVLTSPRLPQEITTAMVFEVCHQNITHLLTVVLICDDSSLIRSVGKGMSVTCPCEIL